MNRVLRREMHRGQALFNPFNDGSAIFTFQGDYHRRHGLPIFAERRSIPEKRNLLDDADVPQQDRYAAVRQHDRVLEVCGAGCAAKAPNGILLLRMLDVSAAEIGVVGGHTLDDVVDC